MVFCVYILRSASLSHNVLPSKPTKFFNRGLACLLVIKANQVDVLNFRFSFTNRSSQKDPDFPNRVIKHYRRTGFRRVHARLPNARPVGFGEEGIPSSIARRICELTGCQDKHSSGYDLLYHFGPFSKNRLLRLIRFRQQGWRKKGKGRTEPAKLSHSALPIDPILHQ